MQRPHDKMWEWIFRVSRGDFSSTRRGEDGRGAVRCTVRAYHAPTLTLPLRGRECKKRRIPGWDAAFFQPRRKRLAGDDRRRTFLHGKVGKRGDARRASGSIGHTRSARTISSRRDLFGDGGLQ